MPDKTAQGVRNEGYEAWLSNEGLTFRFQPDVPLDKFNRKVSLRNQARLEEALDSDIVLKYALAMEEGAKFPAVIGYESAGEIILIGGNHRIAGAETADVQTFGAYIVQTDDRFIIDKLTRLMNTAVEPKGVTLEDAYKQAAYLVITYNKSAAEVARTGNLKADKVELTVRRQRHTQRIVKLGEDTKTMTATVIDQLGAITNDRALKAANEFRRTHKVPTDQFREVVRDVRNATTEDEMLATIRRWERRPDMASRKQHVRGGRSSTNLAVRNKFVTLVTNLAALIEEHSTPQALQLTSAAETEGLLTMWRKTNTQVEGIFKAARRKTA